MGPEETIAAGDDEIRATHKNDINMEMPAEIPPTDQAQNQRGGESGNTLHRRNS